MSTSKRTVGRPKKHTRTQSKTMRLPIDMIEQIQQKQRENESFTDALIRIVASGLQSQ